MKMKILLKKTLRSQINVFKKQKKKKAEIKI